MNWKLPRRMTLPLIVACLALADCRNNTSTTPGPTTAFAVLRFLTSGTPDTSFGGGSGAVTTAITPGLFDFALAVAVQPDNKIVVGGSTGLAGQGMIALVRYNTDGTLDTTGFGTTGTGGIVRTPLGGGSASASAIAVQPADSKILVAALTFAAPGNTGIALLRYNTNGALDPGFGASGVVTAAIGPGLAGDTCALALQVDGKIVVAGASQNGNLVLYRYDANGVLDPNFGTSGIGGSTVTTITPPAMSPAIALSPVTGKIVLVGGTNVDQVVLRYNTDGTLDTTFGTTQTVPGIVVTDINNTVNFANSVAVQADDRIVVAGHANVNFNTDTSDISLVRYNADGTLDTNFVGVNQTVPGIVVTDLGGRFDNAFSVALQTPAVAATNILVSGNSGFSGISQTVLLRYTPVGAPDTTFGTNGVVGANLLGPSNIASGNAVVLQTNIGILVAGYD